MPLPLRHEYAADIPRGLPAGDIDRPGSSPPKGGCARRPSPNPSGWSWWVSLEELSAAGFSRTPSHLACRTQAI